MTKIAEADVRSSKVAADARVLLLDKRDSMAIALRDLRAGDTVELEGRPCTLTTDVPAKHKFALADIAAGAHAVMYGVIVGTATEAIPRGARISTRNLRHDTEGYRRRSGTYQWEAPDVARWRERSFLGYVRDDGQVGTRNYWLVVPLV